MRFKKMPRIPKFKYYLGTAGQTVQKDSEIWSTPIPMSRTPQENTAGTISYGDYFSAVRKFLQRDRFNIIIRALAQDLGHDVTVEAIDEVNVFLEKHGEFYHPAKIEVSIQGLTVALALNVALSEAGKNRIHKEYESLQKLHAEFPFDFLPNVYGLDDFFSQDDAPEIRMFLAEWFQDYFEFHMSRDPADGSYKIVVWDPQHGNYFLTVRQAGDLYRQAAMILTMYYNPETFEQISSWHHAAGDFVVRRQNEKVDLKLITVRHYGPMFGHGKEDETHSEVLDEAMVWQALLVFFLNLAVRMRLDRLDGVGEIVWADAFAVVNTLMGFLDALAFKSADSRFKMPPVDDFLAYLRSCRRTDLYDLNVALVSRYHPRSPDVEVIKQHLKQHVEDLYNAIQISGTMNPTNLSAFDTI